MAPVPKYSAKSVMAVAASQPSTSDALPDAVVSDPSFIAACTAAVIKCKRKLPARDHKRDLVARSRLNAAEGVSGFFLQNIKSFCGNRQFRLAPQTHKAKLFFIWQLCVPLSSEILKDMTTSATTGGLHRDQPAYTHTLLFRLRARGIAYMQKLIQHIRSAN